MFKTYFSGARYGQVEHFESDLAIHMPAVTATAGHKTKQLFLSYFLAFLSLLLYRGSSPDSQSVMPRS